MTVTIVTTETAPEPKVTVQEAVLLPHFDNTAALFGFMEQSWETQKALSGLLHQPDLDPGVRAVVMAGLRACPLKG